MGVVYFGTSEEYMMVEMTRGSCQRLCRFGFGSGRHSNILTLRLGSLGRLQSMLRATSRVSFPIIYSEFRSYIEGLRMEV